MDTVNGWKWLAIIASFSGAVTVAIGAFGAHGLPKHLERAGLDDNVVQRRVENLQVGTRYQMTHTVALLALLALTVAARQPPPWTGAACWLVGMVLFSGGLYVYALTGNRLVVRIVPIGGAAYILGWLMLAYHVYRQPG